MASTSTASSSLAGLSNLPSSLYSNESQQSSEVKIQKKNKPLTYLNLLSTERASSLRTPSVSQRHRRVSSHRFVSSTHSHQSTFTLSRALSILSFTLCLFLLLIPSNVEALRPHTKFYVVRKSSNLGSNGIKKLENEILRLNAGKEGKSFRFRIGLGDSKISKPTIVSAINEAVDSLPNFETEMKNMTLERGNSLDWFNLDVNTTSTLTSQPMPSCSIKFQNYASNAPLPTSILQSPFSSAPAQNQRRVAVGAGQSRWAERVKSFVFSPKSDL